MGPPENQKEYNELVFAFTRRIPRGRVTTYGRIAQQITPPLNTDLIAYSRIGPRWVGYALAKCPNDVPWHRVINAKGYISPRQGADLELQKQLLQDEDIDVSPAGRIDLGEYLWNPDQGRY